jgi:hypothetical protein
MRTIFRVLVFLFPLLTLIFNVLPAFSLFAPAKSVGWEIDLFSLRGGIGKNVSGASFGPGERITLFAYVTYSQMPVQAVLVAFQVNNPQDVPVILNTAQTNSSGYAEIDFTITQYVYPPSSSMWKAIATTSPTQQTVTDVMLFYIVFLLGGTSISIQTPTCTYALIIETFVALALIVNAKIRKNLKKRIFP